MNQAAGNTGPHPLHIARDKETHNCEQKESQAALNTWSDCADLIGCIPPAGASVTGFHGVVGQVVLLYRVPAVPAHEAFRRPSEDAPDEAPALRLGVHLPELLDVINKLDSATRPPLELFRRGDRLVRVLQTVTEAAVVLRPPTTVIDLPLDDVVV